MLSVISSALFKVTHKILTKHFQNAEELPSPFFRFKRAENTEPERVTTTQMEKTIFFAI